MDSLAHKDQVTLVDLALKVDNLVVLKDQVISVASADHKMDNLVVLKDQVALTMAASAHDLMADNLVVLKDQVISVASVDHKMDSLVLKDQVTLVDLAH